MHLNVVAAPIEDGDGEHEEAVRHVQGEIIVGRHGGEAGEHGVDKLGEDEEELGLEGSVVEPFLGPHDATGPRELEDEAVEDVLLVLGEPAEGRLEFRVGV